ncbi:hypothetical protein [Bartonella sp. HY761]|uniref:hypothetical protein n=1 Tax=Bartonella sp. HY761 TaxID=2979330 RepID=UPI0021E34865|nr:hypothetical protein [Bartonella sp. HY761]UXN08150.1 hypothetical protein N6A79_15770 [Bartonella sp. HY761]
MKLLEIYNKNRFGEPLTDKDKKSLQTGLKKIVDNLSKSDTCEPNDVILFYEHIQAINISSDNNCLDYEFFRSLNMFINDYFYDHMKKYYDNLKDEEY